MAKKKQAKGKKSKHARGSVGANMLTRVGTIKYQAQGPTSWERKLQALADKVCGRKQSPLGIGVRAAIAKGLGEPWRPESFKAARYMTKGKQTSIPGVAE